VFFFEKRPKKLLFLGDLPDPTDAKSDLGRRWMFVWNIGNFENACMRNAQPYQPGLRDKRAPHRQISIRHASRILSGRFGCVTPVRHFRSARPRRIAAWALPMTMKVESTAGSATRKLPLRSPEPHWPAIAGQHQD
jgi:hypothetical protein